MKRLCTVAVGLAFIVGSVLVGTAQAEAQQAPPPAPPVAVQFVIDISGSMAGDRLESAKDALTAGIDALAPGQPAGLRSYSGNCGNEGSLEVPVGLDNRDEMHAAVDGLAAGGGTPTPDALQAAANDLAGITGPKIVLLISDGQSTCGDPCPVAAELKAQLGVDFRAFTVGFQAPETAENELRCVADVTGGSYVSATDTEGITQAINDALSGDRPEYVAIGDSTTTGFSVEACVERRAESRFGCVGDPPAPPYPERIATADPRFDDMRRTGIWGYTTEDAVRALNDPGTVEGGWEPQLVTARRATNLVTVSLGANDMRFSDIQYWLGQCIGARPKTFLGTLYPSPTVREGNCRRAAEERANGQVAANIEAAFVALDEPRRNGATVVVALYYNPYNDTRVINNFPDRSCGHLHAIGDIITGALNAQLASHARQHGFRVADLRPAFDGHGAGSADSFVFGTECELTGVVSAAEIDLGWPPRLDREETVRKIRANFDPHPNARGTEAQANTIRGAF